jgi:hypothetical protein
MTSRNPLEPQTVDAPHWALAWVSQAPYASSDGGGHWTDDTVLIGQVRAAGGIVLPVQHDEHGRAHLPAVTGYAPLADVMRLATRVDALAASLDELLEVLYHLSGNLTGQTIRLMGGSPTRPLPPPARD